MLNVPRGVGCFPPLELAVAIVSTDEPDEAPGAMDAGANEQVAPVGNPLQARLMAPLSVPPCAVAVMVDLPESPAFNDKLLGKADSVKSERPVPARVAVATPALLDTTRFPLLAPFVVGVKLTAMKQLAPGANDAGQLLVCAKSPDAVIALIWSASDPELASITFCAALVAPSG